MVCNEYDGIVIRAFADADESIYGAILVPLHADLVVELVSYFRDGSSLATTTNATAADRPDLGMHRQIVKIPQGVNVDSWDSLVMELLDKHREKISAFAGQNRDLEPVDATLLGIAKAIDLSIDRELEAMGWT